MLQFIKGDNFAEYMQVIQDETVDISEALFLDTVKHRLYLNGEALDVRINVIDEVGENFIKKISYEFVNDDGETVRLEDANIPTLDKNYVSILRDIEGKVDNKFNNGLMSVRDKYLLEAMAALLGMEVVYTYYATVHHIEDIYDGDKEVTRDVVVHKNENDEWVYDYDAFEKDVTDNLGQIGHVIEPAGQKVVDESLVRVRTLGIKRKRSDTVFYDGGELPDEYKSLVKHGGLPAGTTVADLEKLTVSEVLSKIIFENAVPQKVCDASLHIRWAEDSDFNGYVEVGHTYPTEKDIVVDFTPETWQWVSTVDGNVIGEPIYLNTVEETVLYLQDFEHPTNPGHKQPQPEWDRYIFGSEGYADHLNEYRVANHDKSVHFAYVKFSANEDAVDSDGNATYVNEEGETVYYAKAYAGEMYSANQLGINCDVTYDVSTNVVEFLSWKSGYKMYSNAAVASEEDIWDARYEDAEYTDIDAQTDTEIFCEDNKVAYFKWGSGSTEEEKFYVYIPEGFEVAEASFADDFRHDYSLDCALTYIEDVQITNKYNAVVPCKKYEVEKCGGITNVRIKLHDLNAVVEENETI